jgi:hypothetical protein
MVAAKDSRPRDGDVLILVGTMKGAFFFRAKAGRSAWVGSGPHFPGRSVYALAYDGRGGRHRIWAGPQSMHFGAELCASDDFGKTWDRPEVPRVRFPEEAGASLKNIWQIEPGRETQPERLYCGVEPAALFESDDAGERWSLAQGLWDHPHRPRWMPGGGGLCLHTILPDPTDSRNLTIAISTGGVYATKDAGATWNAKNKGVRAEFLPDKYPEFGQCVHKIARHPSRPERFFLQNHWGLYKSDDGAESWKDIARGVPSDFGFCMAVSPQDPDTVFIVPLKSDEFRCVPDARLRVYVTRDAGRSWKASTRGLPQKDAYETILRDAMGVDALRPTGVYFGTRSGKLFASRDNGRSWNLVRDGLPPITCVRAAVLPARAARSTAPRSVSRKRARRRAA